MDPVVFNFVLGLIVLELKWILLSLFFARKRI